MIGLELALALLVAIFVLALLGLVMLIIETISYHRMWRTIDPRNWRRQDEPGPD